MKKYFYSVILINFFGFINTINISAGELHVNSSEKINSNLDILAIVNNTKGNMGIIIIGMIVVILALVGYTLISNRK